jgi:hypothetical protein
MREGGRNDVFSCLVMISYQLKFVYNSLVHV